jgi:GNAT superfamily N-acetyltransferase
VRLVGRIDWAVAGCAAAIRSDLPGRTYTSVVVLPEHRRRGLGRGFLERAAAAARGHGSEVLAAGVEEGDEAGEAFAARFGPMRAIIGRLGYQPRPAWIRMEAPLDEVEAALRR